MIVTRRAALLGGATAAAALAAGTGYLALSAGDPAEAVLPPAPEGKVRWRNWSGLQSCIPDSIKVPASVEELIAIVRDAPGPIRPVGAGHSFSPLVPTEGTIVSLDRLNALLAHDDAALTAIVQAGIRLFTLGEALEGIGQAMNALPDINKQSLAGAISTATHGTGATFGSLAESVTGLALVTGGGELVRCSATENAALFDAARVSLGVLGPIAEITIQNRGPLRLERRTWFEPIADAIAAAPERGRKHRYYEFYYVTFTGMAYCIAHDETDAPETPRGVNPENEGTEDLMALRDWLSWAPFLRRMVAEGLIANSETAPEIGPAWRLLSTDRPKRFNEMEYHLPREAQGPCLEAVIAAIEKHNEVYFPIEARFIAPDTAWLSPFYGRESASIAVHMGHTQDHSFFFSEIEPIFRHFEGRPHWGKLNSLTAADAAALYPRWREFQSVRETLDPQGRFLNAPLAALFRPTR